MFSNVTGKIMEKYICRTDTKFLNAPFRYKKF